MVVGLQYSVNFYTIGTGDFFHSFFSTVAVNLENGTWGSRFPYLMNSLYNGKLTVDEIGPALEELATIRTELANFAPDQVVWDIEDREKQPPWGTDFSPDITDLSNYFVTSSGADLIDVMTEALEKAQARGKDVIVKSI